MRYALVTETWPPEVNGVALTVQGLARGLASRGHAVEVVRPRQPADRREDSDEGTLATLLACLVTYKLRDIRVKGLAIPASLPPVVFNMIIVGAFEITFFFSDGAPTAMLAVFNAVTVGIGELISCTILGVALVKLIESNAGLNKIFTEE